MSTLRISDAPLLPDVDGSEKIPTGGRGDLAISMEQVKTFAQGGLPRQIEDHINDTENPHQVSKTQVGLGNVDNTSDVNKPISTATKEALDLKADKTAVHSKSATLPTYYTKEIGVYPVTGVAEGAYFNARSTDEDTMLVEYQNVGGSAVATGKSYPSGSYVENIAEYTALPFKQGKSYALHERVTLTNGDIVFSEINGNIVDPNVDMSGWSNPIKALKNRFVFTSDYGASASKLDNTGELNAAAIAAETYNALLIFNAYYPCTGTVNFPDGLIVCGTSKTKTGFYSTNNIASTAGADVQFSNMKIEGLGRNRIAVSAEDKNLPDFYNCILNGRFNFINRTVNTLKGCSFNQCDVLSNFGADYNGIDQMDVFNIYGFNSAKFTNNYIDVDNVHRLWKLTQGLSDPSLTAINQTNTRDVLIQGNTIKGKGGQQMIDMFFGTSCLKFINNHLELSDQSTLSGESWSVVIDNKTSRPQRDIQDLGDSVYISGNTGFVPCDFLSLQGSFGVTESGFNDSRINSVKLLYNEIRRTTPITTVGAFIQVRHFRSFFSDGNTFQIPQETNAKIIELLSNETVSLGSNDKYTGGFVQFGTTKTNAGNITFSGKTGDIHIGTIEVKDFSAAGAIVFNNLDADSLRIGAFRSRPLVGSAQTCRALSFTGTVRIDNFTIDGIDAKPAVIGGNVAPIFDTISSAARQIYQNCSWQPKFRGYLSAPPTSGTYLRGDTVKHVTPNAGTVEEWTCVSGGSPGTWRASSWIVNKGATASRPTLTANDVGVTYLDTTLSASGKPITWTGTAWVDATGTAV